MTAAPAHAAERFLALLGKDAATARLRAFPAKGSQRKAEIGARAGGWDLQKAAQWNISRGIYLVINDGGDRKNEITACRALFVEWDDRPIDWQVMAWRELGLPEPTAIVSTGGSAHTYWVLNTPITRTEWEPLQCRLIEHCQSDPACKDASRVMRVPGFHYVGANDQPTHLVELIHESGATYSAAEIEACLPPLLEQATIPAPAAPPPPHRDELPPRPLEQVRAALRSLPPRVPGEGSYDWQRPAALGYIHAVLEAEPPGTFEQALADLKAHHPQWVGIEQNIKTSDLSAFTAGSFWEWVKKKGGSARRTDLKAADPLEGFREHPAGTGARQQGTREPSPPRERDLAPEERIALLRDYAEEIYCNGTNPSNRLPLLRNRAFELVLTLRDPELQRLIWDARRKALGQSEGVLQGQRINRTRARWAWEGVFLAGRLNLMVGLQKSGKTALVLAMLAAWSRGEEEFLGCRLHGPCPPVLIVGTDMPEDDWGDMLELAGLMDSAGTIREPIIRLYHAGTPIHLDSEGIEKIAADAEQHPDLLVICDSYAKLTSGLGLDEKDAEFAYPAYDLMEALAPFHATPIVLHHVGKGRAKEGPSMAARGGTALPAAASMIIKIAPAEDGDDGWKDPRRLITTEGRAQPVELLIERQGGTYVGNGSAQELILHKKRQSLIDGLNSRQRQILDEVCRRWSAHQLPSTAADIVEALAMTGADPHRAVRRAFKSLLMVQLVEEELKPTLRAEVLEYRPAEFLRARDNSSQPSEPSEPSPSPGSGRSDTPTRTVTAPPGSSAEEVGQVPLASRDGLNKMPNPPTPSQGDGSDGSDGQAELSRAREQWRLTAPDAPLTGLPVWADQLEALVVKHPTATPYDLANLLAGEGITITTRDRVAQVLELLKQRDAEFWEEEVA